MPADIGQLLALLREPPYEQIRYRWERVLGIHTLTVFLGPKKAGVLITETEVAALREVAVTAFMRRLDQNLWDQITDEKE